MRRTVLPVNPAVNPEPGRRAQAVRQGPATTRRPPCPGDGELGQGGRRGPDAVVCWAPAAGDASSATAVRVCTTSERQRIGQNDGCLNATPSSEGEAACLIPGGLCFCGCQERHDRVGDGIGGAPGQVMTRAVDELQAGIWEGAGGPAGGIAREPAGPWCRE